MNEYDTNSEQTTARLNWIYTIDMWKASKRARCTQAEIINRMNEMLTAEYLYYTLLQESV